MALHSGLTLKANLLILGAYTKCKAKDARIYMYLEEGEEQKSSSQWV